MNKAIKLFGVIALAVIIGFSMAACSADSSDGSGGGGGGGDLITVGTTSGSLTITGLAAYNGKYVIASDDNGENYIAATSINGSTFAMTGGLVSGGSVTLKIWKTNQTGLGNYNGTEQLILYVTVLNKSTVTGDELDSLGGPSNPAWLVTMGSVAAFFTSGIGSGPFEGENEGGNPGGNPGGNEGGNPGGGGGAIPSELVAMWYMDINANGVLDLGSEDGLPSYEFQADGKLLIAGTDSGSTFTVSGNQITMIAYGYPAPAKITFTIVGKKLTLSGSNLSGFVAGDYVKP